MQRKGRHRILGKNEGEWSGKVEITTSKGRTFWQWATQAWLSSVIFQALKDKSCQLRILNRVPTAVHGTGTRLLTPQSHRVRPPPQWCTSPVVFQSRHVPVPWEHDGNGTYRGGGRPSLQVNGPQWDTVGLRRIHTATGRIHTGSPPRSAYALSRFIHPCSPTSQMAKHGGPC